MGEYRKETDMIVHIHLVVQVVKKRVAKCVPKCSSMTKKQKKGRASFVRRKREKQKKAGDSKKGRQRSKGKKPTYTKK